MMLLDLTRDDVLGDRYQFVPAFDPNIELVRVDEFGTQIPVKNVQPELRDEEPIQEEVPQEEVVETVEEPVVSPIPEIAQPQIELVEEEPVQAPVKLPALPITAKIIDETIADLVRNSDGTYTVTGKNIGRTFLNACGITMLIIVCE